VYQQTGISDSFSLTQRTPEAALANCMPDHERVQSRSCYVESQAQNMAWELASP